MSCISWNKEYVFINADGHLATKSNGDIDKISLNFFQRIIRSLGFYANTHLNAVSSAVKNNLFTATWSLPNKLIITKVALKALKLEGTQPSEILLIKETLNNGIAVECKAKFPLTLVDRNFKLLKTPYVCSFREISLQFTVTPPEGDAKMINMRLDGSVFKRDYVTLTSMSRPINEEDLLLVKVAATFLRSLQTKILISRDFGFVGEDKDPILPPNPWDLSEKLFQPSSYITKDTIPEDLDYQLKTPISLDLMLI